MSLPRLDAAALFEGFGRSDLLMAVDGNNLLMRSIKAMEHSGLSSDEGISTAAIHAYIQSLAGHVSALSPSHIVIFWDGGRSEYRSGIFPDYKGQRVSSYDSEYDAFDLAHGWHEVVGIQQERFDGWEADDLIARAVLDFGYWTGDVVIISGDKDLLQLVDDHRVTQVRPGQDGHWNRRRVIKEYGVEPEDVPLVLAMMGDSADNIPGIRGVGVKTAAKYIRKHGPSIETICSEEKRLSDEDAVVLRRNVSLIDLRCIASDIPRSSDPVRFSPVGPDSDQASEVRSWLDRYELRSVKERWATDRLWSR